MHVGGIFCDLAKDFDCMNHEIMLAKLHLYGIGGVPEVWFGYFVSNRRQEVQVKAHNSAQSFFSD